MSYLDLQALSLHTQPLRLGLYERSWACMLVQASHPISKQPSDFTHGPQQARSVLQNYGLVFHYKALVSG